MISPGRPVKMTAASPPAGAIRRCRHSPWPALAVVILAALAGGRVAAAELPAVRLPTTLARWLSSDLRRLDDRRQALQRDLATTLPPPDPETTTQLGWRVFDYEGRPWRGQQWVEVDFGEPIDFDAVAFIPAYLATTDFPAPGYGFPIRFRVEAFGANARPQTIADFSQADFAAPGALPVWLPAPGSRARRVRLTILVPWRNGTLHACALAEFMVLRGRRNLATGLPGVVVRTSDSRESPPTWSRAHLIDGQSPLGAPVGPRLPPGTAVGHCWHSQFSRTAQSVKWVQVDLGQSRRCDEIRLVPARLPQRLHQQGYGFPVRFRVEVDDDPAFSRPHLIADHTAVPFPNPGFNPVTLPAGVTARYVRVTATELQHRSDGQYHFALAELQAYAGDTNLALGAPVSFFDNLEASPNWRATFLTDGARWEYPLSEWSDWLAHLSHRRDVQRDLAQVEAEIAPLLQSLARTASWTSLALALGGALLLVAVYYRLQLRRVHEADALRRRIAADLHDDLGSNLASLSLLSELCLQSRDPVPRADLAELHALARETGDALRDTTWLIRPGAHTPDQFLDRLRATARRLLAGVEWTFDAADFREPLALDVQRHLLLALKEALHNVVRHAGARHVRISLRATGGRFTLTVIDDGRGFDPTAGTSGQGLVSLRHRAGLLGGEARFFSAPGAGATITLTGRLASAPDTPASHG